jgi:ribosome biogenesis GTPase
MNKEGIVIKSTGSWYQVLIQQEVIACRIKGKFKLKEFKLTNPVAVGDHVVIEMNATTNESTIIEILPRKNYVLRRSTRQKHLMHLIASNIDQAFLVTSIKKPTVKPGFIDRFLLSTLSYDIPSWILFNKSDLYDSEDYELFQILQNIYKNAGYNCLLVSVYDAESLSRLEKLIQGKTSLFSGHSGVGKSTLINHFHPMAELKTGEISQYSEKGMHTTTFAEMFEIKEKTRIIDTPGIKEMGFLNMEKQDVAHNYQEFFEFSKNCKFNDCLHLNEPGCAVKKAIESGNIHELRYQSYMSILDEIENQKYWEIQED